MDYFTKMEPGEYYHIYNRSNAKELIFRNSRNAAHFHKLIYLYISPVAEILAYCILGNHFHMIVRIRDAASIKRNSKVWCLQRGCTAKILNPSRQISDACNAYAKAINKEYERNGSVFQERFRRIPLRDVYHIRRLITYVHINPQRHGLTEDFSEWFYSSYHNIVNGFMERELWAEIMAIYGGLEAFKKTHAEMCSEMCAIDREMLYKNQT